MKNSVFLLVLLLLALTINVNSQWESDMRLTNDSNNSLTSYNNASSIASSGNIVHVIWSDNPRVSGYPQIFYKRSSDGGVSWGTDMQMTSNTWYFTGHPSIFVSGPVVHLAWIYNHNAFGMLFYKHSTDAGISWWPNTQISTGTLSMYFPSLAVSGSIVYVVATAPSSQLSRIFYTRSENSGQSWAATSPLVTTTSTSQFAAVSTSGSVTNIVWQDNRDGNEEIYYIRSTDNGLSWGVETRLTNNAGYSSYPSISSSGSLALVAWQENRDGNYEIYYKRSTNGGLSWGADTRLTNNSDSSYYPSVYVSGSNVHVAWQDYRDGNWEVYYNRSTDGGGSWGADTRLTSNSAASITPSITVSNSSVYVVWSDNSDGNYEVYFKRNPTGNPVGIININTEIPKEFSLSQNYPNPFNPS